MRVTKHNPPFVSDPWIQSDDYICSCLKQSLPFVNVVHLSRISWGNVVNADNKSSCKIMCAGLETSASLWMFPSQSLPQPAGYIFLGVVVNLREKAGCTIRYMKKKETKGQYQSNPAHGKKQVGDSPSICYVSLSCQSTACSLICTYYILIPSFYISLLPQFIPLVLSLSIHVLGCNPAPLWNFTVCFFALLFMKSTKRSQKQTGQSILPYYLLVHVFGWWNI